jgi:hypothetical protein
MNISDETVKQQQGYYLYSVRLGKQPGAEKFAVFQILGNT